MDLSNLHEVQKKIFSSVESGKHKNSCQIRGYFSHTFANENQSWKLNKSTNSFEISSPLFLAMLIRKSAGKPRRLFPQNPGCWISKVPPKIMTSTLRHCLLPLRAAKKCQKCPNFNFQKFKNHLAPCVKLVYLRVLLLLPKEAKADRTTRLRWNRKQDSEVAMIFVNFFKKIFKLSTLMGPALIAQLIKAQLRRPQPFWSGFDPDRRNEFFPSCTSVLFWVI